MITMMASAPLTGGLIDNLEHEENERGPEPDESEGQFLRVLIPHVGVGTSLHPLAPRGSGRMQCDRCGGWFGVTFWTCGTCQALSRLTAAAQRNG